MNTGLLAVQNKVMTRLISKFVFGDLQIMDDTEIPLAGTQATIFKYIQVLISQTAGPGKTEKFKRIWEPTYTYA